jgi:hypothetical protein
MASSSKKTQFDGGGSGGNTMTVVFSPGFPVAPWLPVSPW